jgi:hypothetical protein
VLAEGANSFHDMVHLLVSAKIYFLATPQHVLSLGPQKAINGGRPEYSASASAVAKKLKAFNQHFTDNSSASSAPLIGAYFFI